VGKGVGGKTTRSQSAFLSGKRHNKKRKRERERASKKNSRSVGKRKLPPRLGELQHAPTSPLEVGNGRRQYTGAFPQNVGLGGCGYGSCYAVRHL